MPKLAKTRVHIREAWVPVRAGEATRHDWALGLTLELREPRTKVDELHISETWVESPLGADWIAAYRIVADHGVPVIGEVRIFPNEDEHPKAGSWSGEYVARPVVPSGGLTRRVLDQIKLTEPMSKAGEFMERIRAFAAPQLERRGLATTKARRRRGRKGHGDLFYAQVARDYVAAVEAGSSSPATDVARRRRLGANGPARIRDLLHEARRRGFLTPAPVRGRRGGDLTPQGRAILDAGAESGARRGTRKET